MKKKIEQEVKKLKLKGGDTLVIRTTVFDSTKDMEFLERLRDLYKKQNKEIYIINIPMSMDIEKLNENQMNELGWYRKEGDDFSE
jgi:hypothetical protein